MATIDYKHINYQSYVFLAHKKRGMMVLQRLYNPFEEHPKYEIPGGPIQDREFEIAAKKRPKNIKQQLAFAARHAAARTLYEITHIDVRRSMKRLSPAIFNNEIKESGTIKLENEYQYRFYYFLNVTKDDFILKKEKKHDQPHIKLRTLIGEPINKGLPMLRLAPKYNAFTFASDPTEAIELLQEHHAGQSAEALKLILTKAGFEEVYEEDENKGENADGLVREELNLYEDPKQTTPMFL